MFFPHCSFLVIGLNELEILNYVSLCLVNSVLFFEFFKATDICIDCSLWCCTFVMEASLVAFSYGKSMSDQSCVSCVAVGVQMFQTLNVVFKVNNPMSYTLIDRLNGKICIIACPVRFHAVTVQFSSLSRRGRKLNVFDQIMKINPFTGSEAYEWNQWFWSRLIPFVVIQW